MHENLKQLPPRIRDLTDEAVAKLARKFQLVMKKNSPVDTGHLEGSWYYSIEKTGPAYIIRLQNNALSLDGHLYYEWVNDGHRIVRYGVTVGYQEGQFFMEGAEDIMEQKHLPGFEKRLEREIVRMIRDAMA